jgi:hypothetical protein
VQSEKGGKLRRSFNRHAAAFGLAAAMLACLAIVGSTAFGKGKPSAAQYQYKVTICHHTGSTNNPTVTIKVSSRALPAHLAHGDTLGPCPTQSQGPAGSSGSSKGNAKDKQNAKGNANANAGGGNGNGKGK